MKIRVRVWPGVFGRGDSDQFIWDTAEALDMALVSLRQREFPVERITLHVDRDEPLTVADELEKINEVWKDAQDTGAGAP